VLAALATGLAGAGCSGPVSYVVVTLQSLDATTPITGVTDVVVTVTRGMTEMKTLTYHHDDPLSIDQVTATTLSVSFTSNELGNVSFHVQARAQGCLVGVGDAPGVVKRAAVTPATVMLAAVSNCPDADGGVIDGGGEIFPGCDPVNPSCGANMTCHVNCTKRVGECTASGSGAAGSICRMNSDCMPGTQCFDYNALGCGVKVCLRFCNGAGDCTQPADGGVGVASLCEGPVQCGSTPTGYHTCTFACDPRRAAIAASSGCPAGLSCLVTGNMDQVDCACPEASRTKAEGEDCARASDCAPGLICDIMTGAQKCRAICRCDAQGPSCTAANDCTTANTHCTPLTNDTVFGVCL
jgi:hypothetical protein